MDDGVDAGEVADEEEVVGVMVLRAGVWMGWERRRV